MTVPATIDPSIAPLIALLGSSSKGEQAAAVSGIARKLVKTGATFNDLAARIEGGGGVPQHELNIIEDRAYERGYRHATEAARQKAANRVPTLAEQVQYLTAQSYRLKSHERNFVRDMSRSAWRGSSMKASTKQTAWIESLYDRLKGEV